MKSGLFTLDAGLADSGTAGIPDVGRYVGVNSIVGESVLDM